MGFDPLHLFDPANGGSGVLSQDWLRYAEVVHGRWAMLGVVGCLTPEALAMRGTIPPERGVEWFRTGFLPTVGQEVDFGWDPYSIAWVQAKCCDGGCGCLRHARVEGASLPLLDALCTCCGKKSHQAWISKPPVQPVLYCYAKFGGDPVYPGGPVFNFLDVVESASATRRFKEKEIKHGRLAMVAMLGFFVQAAYTGVGPYSNLVEHVMDPFGENIITNLFGLKD
ncbi:regulatory chlorophyll a/b-binding protein [Dunaliella salina]|uniref:Chlorophyll a-b binding protein, chloroplastic n=1 Tax=Dunaliella salina TaxID=3046 RepID=A0ABQ7H2Q4_DUNSA|nr:regulatory chlorophyll a/b-binding protein [Dunaliella salina]|eukprot:KAF5841139.1 regulatory chlorophyll a/b-binding protein [Dunaliella salina]